MLTKRQVAAGLSVQPNTVDNLRRRDATSPSPHRLGPRTLRWDPDAIDRWLLSTRAADDPHRTGHAVRAVADAKAMLRL